jgi:hypothetical protein
MISLLLVCLTICSDYGEPADAAADRQAYQSAEKKAGDDAAAQIKLALWCEAHGLTAERLKHLAKAVAADPSNALARGLSGLVAFGGQWLKPEVARDQAQADPKQRALNREYLDRRVRTPDTADGQLKLAAWCADKGLKEQALAHYTAVTRLDPRREIAWKHLGYKKSGAYWVKPDEIAALKLEAERQKHADQHWKPRLEKLREGLESPHALRREKARAALAQVTDPRALPAILKVFGNGSETMQLVAVKLLEQIEGPSASNALATRAIFSGFPKVRDAARIALSRRDPRDVVGRLIALVRRPYKYKVVPGKGPGSSGELIVDGESFDVRRLYKFPIFDARLAPSTISIGVFDQRIQFGQGDSVLPLNDFFSISGGPAQSAPMPDLASLPPVARGAIASLESQGNGGSVGNLMKAVQRVNDYNMAMAAQTEMMMQAAMLETVERNRAVQQSLENDLRLIETLNDQMNDVNNRVLPVLASLTGEDFGSDPKAWRKWWTDQLGYVYQSSQPATQPVYSDTVELPDVTPTIPLNQIQFVDRISHSCFAKGTPVETSGGPRPIESIKIGDRVLSQNTTTGILVYAPVIGIHSNGPAPTLRIKSDGETVVATLIHRFWIPGKGWTMARELKPGDRLRITGGVVTIESIETDETQPVFNLDVAENRNFFVGTKRLLVHDFSFVLPVLAPFDRVAEITPTSGGR